MIAPDGALCMAGGAAESRCWMSGGESLLRASSAAIWCAFLIVHAGVERILTLGRCFVLCIGPFDNLYCCKVRCC